MSTNDTGIIDPSTNVAELDEFEFDPEDPATGDERETKLIEANKKLFARAKAAEAALKAKAPEVKTNPEPQVPQQTPEANVGLSRDEAILIAKGMEDEDIKILKKIQAGEAAIGNKISLTEAAKDPIFVAFQEKKAHEAEVAAAAVPKSNAFPQSGGSQEPKTREEHKAMVLAAMAKAK